MFLDRQDAGRKLAERLRGRPLERPLVLGVPRGGVVVAEVLARELGAELDVVLARKIRAPYQTELAIGSVSEDGEVHVRPDARHLAGVDEAYLKRAAAEQMQELARRRELYRTVRPAVDMTGRSVIVTDDGVATGETFLAALHAVRARHPKEIIAAIPVAPAEFAGRLEGPELQGSQQWCDEAIILHAPGEFWAVGQFYQRFRAVEDQQVLEILRRAAPPAREQTGSSARAS